MINKIKVQPLTPEAFAPYGSAICIPTDGNPDRPTDRFNFWPKLATYNCDDGNFQIGVSTFFKRPYRTMNLERHYHTQEFMTPLNGSIIIVFVKNKGTEPGEEIDFKGAEAFLIKQDQAVIVDKYVWHWTPMPIEDQTSIICSFAVDTQWKDLEIQNLPKGEVIEAEF